METTIRKIKSSNIQFNLDQVTAFKDLNDFRTKAHLLHPILKKIWNNLILEDNSATQMKQTNRKNNKTMMQIYSKIFSEAAIIK